MRLEVERRCRGVRPHYFEGRWLYATRGNRWVRTADLGRTFEPLARVHTDTRRLVARVRAVDRLLHASPFCVVPTPSGAMAFSGQGARLWRRGAAHFTALDGPVDFRPMRAGVGLAPDGSVLVGEYRDNGGEVPQRPRDPVHVWRWRDGVWSVAWRFRSGQVRHVHAVVAHPDLPDTFFVCTGDADAESVVWVTDDDFATLRPWLSAGQVSRTCSLELVGGRVVWGIDSPLETSGVCSAAFPDTAVVRHTDTEGPIYYSGRNAAGHVWFGVSVEPGPAVHTDRVQVVASVDGAQTFERVFSRRADPTPQLSCILSPRGISPENTVVFFLRATMRWDGQLVVARLLA